MRIYIYIYIYIYKLNGCANSVVNSVATWQAWRVTSEHIEFKGGVGEGERTWDKGGGYARNPEDSHHIYIYIYNILVIKCLEKSVCVRMIKSVGIR